MNKTELIIRSHLKDFELRTGCKVLYVAIIGSSEYDGYNADYDVDVAFVYDHPEKGIMPLKKNINFKVDNHGYIGFSHISHVRNLAIGSTQNWNVAMGKRIEWDQKDAESYKYVTLPQAVMDNPAVRNEVACNLMLSGWGMFMNIRTLEYSNIHVVKQAIRAIAIAGKGLNIYNKDVFNQNYEREFAKSLVKVTPLFGILRDARNGIAFEGDLNAMLAKDMDKIKTLVETLKDNSIGVQGKPLRYIHGGYEKFDMFDMYQSTMSIFLNKHFS